MPPQPPLLVGRPACCQYRITAANPRVDFPFSWPFQLTAQRLGPEGYSVANKYWYIPITGVSLKEVPNVYPVASDPNLIFMVLRDPPGGASFTTISRGTSATFGVAIDGMYVNLHTTYLNDNDDDNNNNNFYYYYYNNKNNNNKNNNNNNKYNNRIIIIIIIIIRVIRINF